jgi:hypothetical protein
MACIHLLLSRELGWWSSEDGHSLCYVVNHNHWLVAFNKAAVCINWCRGREHPISKKKKWRFIHRTCTLSCIRKPCMDYTSNSMVVHIMSSYSQWQLSEASIYQSLLPFFFFFLSLEIKTVSSIDASLGQLSLNILLYMCKWVPEPECRSTVLLT